MFEERLLRPPKPSPRTAITYFIKERNSGGAIYIKIGRVNTRQGRRSSDRIALRLAQIQNGNPRPLEVFAIFHGDIEAELHRRFFYLRARRGGWFKRSPVLEKFIIAHCRTYSLSPRLCRLAESIVKKEELVEELTEQRPQPATTNPSAAQGAAVPLPAVKIPLTFRPQAATVVSLLKNLPPNSWPAATPGSLCAVCQTPAAYKISRGRLHKQRIDVCDPCRLKILRELPPRLWRP